MRLIALVAAAALTPVQAVPRYVVAYKAPCIPPAAKTTALSWNLGFSVDFRYHAIFEGFAAQLTPEQAAAVRADPDVDWAQPEGTTYVLGSTDTDGVVPQLRYEHALHGFAARVTAADLAALELGGARWARPDPYAYVAMYREGVAAHAKTEGLADRLGFTPKFFYDTLGGFAATLTKEQLGQLDRDPDIQVIGPNGWGNLCEPGPGPEVLAWKTEPAVPSVDRDFTVRAVVASTRRPRCSAVVGRRRLGARVANMRDYVAMCRWRVPRNARGRVLRGTLAVEGASRSFAFRVR